MAFNHLLPGISIVLLNNEGKRALNISYVNDADATVIRVGPDGQPVTGPGPFPLATTFQSYFLYPSGKIKTFEAQSADGSHIVLNFADGGSVPNLDSIAYGPNSGGSGIYGHGPLVSSTFTDASGYTITQEFAQGHLVNYSLSQGAFSFSGTYNVATNTYSLSLQNSVHTSPLVATGGGNIDEIVKVISNDGSSIISQDGAGLISQDGAGIRTTYNGAAIISDHASGLNLLNIAAIISQDGAGVISNDGSSLISQDGAGIMLGDHIVNNLGLAVNTAGSSLAGNEALQFGANTMALLGRGTSLYTGPTTFTSGPADDNTQFFIRQGEQRVDKIDFLGDTDLWDIRQTGGIGERQLVAGQTYLIDLKGSSTGDGTLIDPFLRIYAADKTTVVAQSDDDGAGFNARLLFTPTTTGRYYIEAGARDEGSSGTYTLSLLDPAPVIFAPGDADTVTIDKQENGDFITTVIADDPDSGSTLTYSIIGGEDSARFGINPFNGQLFFIIAPDFELPTDADENNSYIVQVQASDGVFTDSQTIIVNVTDVDEGPLAPEIAVWGNHHDIVDGDTSKSLDDFTDFGSARTGGVLERTFFVLNQGSAPLRIDKIVTPAGFRIADDDQLAGLIQPGSFDSFKVYMDTSKVGSKTGQIVITSNDSNEKIFNFTIGGSVVAANPEIVVTGNDVDIPDGSKTPITTNGTSLGTVLIGDSVLRTFTVSNAGDDPLTIAKFKMNGGPSSPISMTLVEPLEATIAPGQSDTFTVRFDANKAATFKGTFSFDTNDANEAKYDFAVGATVLAAPTPEIAVSGNGADIKDNDRTPSVLDHTAFGLSNFGEAGAIRTFTIDNTGLGELVITDLTVPEGFELIGPVPETVDANSSATFDVQIKTDATGSRGGTINIFSNDANEALFNFNIVGLVGPEQRAGDNGPNIFNAAAHAEGFAGQDGNDTVSYGASTAAVVASLLSATKNTGFAAGDAYDSIENLVGSQYNDTLTGNAHHNVLEGGKGADKLDGGSTSATDFDTASYINAEADGEGRGVTANLLKSANNQGEAAGDTYKNIEGLLGSQFDDTLYGNTASNHLNGFDGDDVLAGGGGQDVLTGGLDSDRFQFNALKDCVDVSKPGSAQPPFTGAIITDFVSGEDTIGIVRTGFKISPLVDHGGAGAFDFADYFVSSAGAPPTEFNPAGVAATASGHGQFLFNESTDQLWWDPDGAGTKAKILLLATFSNGEHPLVTDFDLL